MLSTRILRTKILRYKKLDSWVTWRSKFKTTTIHKPKTHSWFRNTILNFIYLILKFNIMNKNIHVSIFFNDQIITLLQCEKNSDHLMFAKQKEDLSRSCFDIIRCSQKVQFTANVKWGAPRLASFANFRSKICYFLSVFGCPHNHLNQCISKQPKLNHCPIVTHLYLYNAPRRDGRRIPQNIFTNIVLK